MVEGAFGAGKAGADFNLVLFARRPLVVLRFFNWLFAIIVFGCISSQGYALSPNTKRRYCLYNENPNACNYGVAIGVIAFLASMIFLAGEYLFEQMSSVKSRKHYVLADLIFHALWAFLYFVGFCYLTNQWGASAEPPLGYSSSNVVAAIVFCLFSTFTCGACAFFAYERFRLGVDAAIAGGGGKAGAPYPMGNETEQYNEPPFSGPQRV